VLQIGTPTVYAGLTLGGVLATSAHGSGYLAPSGIWDTLLEITWVDGTGKVSLVACWLPSSIDSLLD
jgi:hypothetical protein